jgi:peptidoglycan/xylan/chitin deacetylase (PgdA/CDA1 family)
MRWQSFLGRAISDCIYFSRINAKPRNGLRVLTYHSVGSHAYGDTLNLNTISIKNFRSHVEILREHSVIGLDPVVIPSAKQDLCITFDDGYADNLYAAAPLLNKANLPFTVFISTDFIKNRINGFLSPTELKELANLPGVTIGSHGASHCDLTRCGSKKLKEELISSKLYLEDLLGRPINSISYPFGKISDSVRITAEELGYTIGAAGFFNINPPGRDRMALSRCVVLSHDTPRLLNQKLRGDWDWHHLRSKDPYK